MLSLIHIYISIGRKSHRFAGVAFDFITDTAFLADVAGIPLIEQVSDGCQFVFSLGRVDVVRNGNKSDVMVREKFFCQPPDLDIVSAQTGKVFLCQVGTKKFLRFYKPFIGGQPPVNGLLHLY